jgi:hypothetical protein
VGSGKLNFLGEEGAMSALLRSHAWPASPLGAPDDWRQYVTLRLTDTGPHAAMIERAFDPVFTTRPLGQGSGLRRCMDQPR